MFKIAVFFLLVIFHCNKRLHNFILVLYELVKKKVSHGCVWTTSPYRMYHILLFFLSSFFFQFSKIIKTHVSDYRKKYKKKRVRNRSFKHQRYALWQDNKFGQNLTNKTFIIINFPSNYFLFRPTFPKRFLNRSRMH